MNLIQNLPADQYHAADRINCSGLKQFLKSPAHYRAYKDQPQEETKAMMLGSAVHTAVLEPNTFNDRYIFAPEGIDKRTKEGKERWAVIEATGKIVLKQDEWEQVIAIKDAVRSHGTAGKLLDTGKPEVTVYTEMDGCVAKCRLDWQRPGIIVDLKTTEDASPAGFAKAIAKYNYAMQAAWYLDCAASIGLEIESFIFIAVEKSAPYAVGIYELDEESIEFGRAQYQKALSLYKYCESTGEWPGYDESIITLKLPKWATWEEQ